MAKRKSATTERSAAETTTRTQRSDARIARPAAASRAKAKARAEVSLRVAPTNGSRHAARLSQKPADAAVTPAKPAEAAPAAPAAGKRMRASSSRRFGDLRAALAEGWEIVQPIFARPLWSAADDSQTAYNFVLRRDQATRLLTIPDSRTVARFIATHSLTVDYPR